MKCPLCKSKIIEIEKKDYITFKCENKKCSYRGSAPKKYLEKDKKYD